MGWRHTHRTATATRFLARHGMEQGWLLVMVWCQCRCQTAENLAAECLLSTIGWEAVHASSWVKSRTTASCCPWCVVSCMHGKGLCPPGQSHLQLACWLRASAAQTAGGECTSKAREALLMRRCLQATVKLYTMVPNTFARPYPACSPCFTTGVWITSIKGSVAWPSRSALRT